MAKNRGTSFALAVVVAAIVLAIGFQVVTAATSDGVETYVNESSEWCEERGGVLMNVNAIWHGGLHCELPNGTSVHMSDVVEVGDSG